MQTVSPVLVAVSGAVLCVLLGSQRLSSSKGQTPREGRTQRDRTGAANASRLLCRRGGPLAKTTVHPATHGDRKSTEVVPIRGRVLPGTSRTALLLCSVQRT